MAQDWLSDVRKYVADADEAVVDKIVKYLGIALQNRDSSLVSFSDKKETERVRENFLKKKLGLTHSDDVLDGAIAAVGDRMKEDRTKNRVTAYYLLAEHFGLLSLFGGAAGSAAPLAAAGLAGAAAASATSAAAAPVTDTVPEPAAEPVRMMSEPAATPPPASYGGNGDIGSSDSGGGLGWLKWLLLAALLLLLIFLALRYCAPAANVPATSEAPAATSDATAADQAATTADTASTATPAATAVPQGSGVVASDVAGKPKLTVYFDSGKTDVSNDLATAATNVKAYLDKNPGAKLAVSGYNDPSGNAAINAEVSKKRAQGVKAALEKVGIPADSIELVKPADTTDTSGDATAARRVEVTIK